MKTLLESNPYLKDREAAKAINSRSAKTSCGVEGIVITDLSQKVKLDTSKSKLVYKRIKVRLDNS